MRTNLQLTRRALLAGAAATVPIVAYGGGVTRPPARAGRVTPPSSFEGIFQASGLAQNSGCVLVDLQSGRVVEQHNPDLARPPASVTKTMTALYAQAQLGNDYRFETVLLATGPINGGTLEGDLYLIGSGDPTLDTDRLNRLAKAAKATGLRRISGRFYVVSSALPLIEAIDPNQPIQVGYNPGLSGLNLNYNRVYFEWKRQSGQYRVTMDARSEQLRPQIGCATMSVSRRGAPTYGYEHRGGVEHWSVAQSALGNGGGRWLPVRDPATYSAEVFQVLAGAQGISLPQAQNRQNSAGGTVIARLQSDDLRSIERSMLRYSTNLTAEVLGLSATKAAGGRIGTLRLSAQAMGRWVARQSRQSRPTLYNHSGLTDQSRITAREMALFLAKPSSRNGLAGILKEIWLENARGDGVEIPGVRIFAKSGTLNFTRGLAGYIEKNNQQRYAFAIFAADMAARRAAAASTEEHPRGARHWRDVAKAQEKALVYRWASLLA